MLSGSYSGDGSGLSNIVTSLVAGSGITINNTTGAVTITNSSQGVGANDVSTLQELLLLVHLTVMERVTQ